MFARHSSPVMCIALACAIAAGAAAQDFEVPWFTFDGGGAMWATGGDFEVSGSIAQPDASAVVMTGGGFKVSGGFWPGALHRPGACCQPDGSCAITLESECAGVWHGAWSSCDPNPCPQPAACCFVDGSCQMRTEADCLGVMGFFQGDGTVCDPNPCPPPGACCQPAGSCIVLPEFMCTGVWQGAGTDCTPNPCPGPPGSWHFETIDSDGSVGRLPSLAVDADGIPHVAYWDDMTVRVKYAKRVGGVWQVEFISEFQGRYPSLALDAQGRPHISWNKAVFGSPVMYTYWDGAQWITQQLPSEVHRGHNNRSSLALTAGGLPRLAVMPTGSETFTSGLDYLAWDGSAWSRVQLVSGGTQAGVPALALDPNGDPRIVWHILWSSGAEFLKCFWSDGAGWSSETITTAIENLTLFDRASLAIDASGTPHTVFTSTSGPLMHARRTASGWEFEQIGAYPPLPSESSIALDAYDDPHVAVGHWSVRYAHRALAPWTVETVVPSTGPENTPCIAVGPNGYPHIAWWDCIGNNLEYAWWERSVPGDFDGDGDVDLDDYEVINDCLEGPEGPLPPECAPADLDGDQDVDLEDFAEFQRSFTGP